MSASALRKWERGQRSPTGAAATLLKIIDREPRAVLRALKADRPHLHTELHPRKPAVSARFVRDGGRASVGRAFMSRQ